MEIKENQYYTVMQVCELLQISKMTLYRWINAGKIKYVQIGKMYRFNGKEIKRILKE